MTYKINNTIHNAPKLSVTSAAVRTNMTQRTPDGIYPSHAIKGSIKGYSSAQGFTYIELAISVVLGLLVLTAAVSILVTSSQTRSIQEASSSIQDSLVFPVNQIKHHIRRANYGAKSAKDSGFYLTYSTPQGGIVLTAPNETSVPAAPSTGSPVTNVDNSSLADLKFKNAKISTNLLSRPNHSDSNVQQGGKALKNDQLTIQYQMPIEGKFDCMGREIPKDYYVIERYFVRDDNGSKALACASTNYQYQDLESGDSYIEISKFTSPDGTKSDSGFDGKGAVVIPDVDYFRVLLSVTDQKNFAVKPEELKMVNVPLSNTPDKDLAGLRIAGVQVGMILRSSATTSSAAENSSQSFNVLDLEGVKLNSKTASGGKYLRDVHETSVLIRNARGRD